VRNDERLKVVRYSLFSGLDNEGAFEGNVVNLTNHNHEVVESE